MCVRPSLNLIQTFVKSVYLADHADFPWLSTLQQMLLNQEVQASERWWSDAARKMPSPVPWTDGQSRQHAATKKHQKTMDVSGRANYWHYRV